MHVYLEMKFDLMDNVNYGGPEMEITPTNH